MVTFSAPSASETLRGLERVLDGLADLGLGAAQEALAVAEALGFRIEAPVDDLHQAIRSRDCNDQANATRRNSMRRSRREPRM